MSLAPDGWLDRIEVGIDWIKSSGFAVQVDGMDLVHVTDIDAETGTALVRVFASTHPDAAVMFEAVINLRERPDAAAHSLTRQRTAPPSARPETTGKEPDHE